MFENSDPKLTFVFGLVTGIAVVSVLVSGSLLSVMNKGGSELVATQPADNVVAAVDSDNGSEPTPTLEVASDLPEVTENDHVLGNLSKAKVVLVEYSDFECSFCKRHHPTMIDIVEEYGDDVAWVYRHFPLSFHPEATPSALASECAAEQGMFWEYGDELFENQSTLGDELYLELATDLGLDTAQFQDCYESEKYLDKVEEQTTGGSAAGVRGTPATFVNGQLVSGAVPLSSLTQVIDLELLK